VQEQEVLGRFFDEIAREGTYCFGVEETMYAVTSGLVETLVLWKNLPHVLCEMVLGEEKKTIYYHPDAAPDGGDWTVVLSVPLLDWILEHYKEFGVTLQLVSDQSSIGSQFVKGFGGIGGFLRFEMDLPSLTMEPEDEEYVW